MHIPDSFLNKAGRQRIRQAEERAARKYRHNVAAKNAFVSLARHIEAEKHTAQIVARLKSEGPRKKETKEAKRRRDLVAAVRKRAKAARDVAYARELLLRAERNPQSAARAAQPVQAAQARGRSGSGPQHAEPMWIGSHWTRSTS
ncbi:hypothetical protein GCM10009759_39310 [Kitasatospora saccharophila]|uniref:Uncharacterized protein n=1 Tax=Kitasatospora saccharophila TaxID=407973 RepID=A0ABP5IP47_9ACTN